MGGGHDFSSGNRARIAVVIVLNGDVSLPDSADGWKVAGFIAVCTSSWPR